MFQQSLILVQRLGVAGAELADGVVQEGAALGGACFDQGEVFGAEQDGAQDLG